MDRRLSYLVGHYHNSHLLNVKYRDALARIVANPYNAQAMAQEALDGPFPPPPLAHLYDEGLHTGHPFEEYLELPMRPTDDFAPCETCSGTTSDECHANSRKARGLP